MIQSAEEKSLARSILKNCRGALSLHRREEAKMALSATLLPLLQPYSLILSFHSLKEEIDTSFLNAVLASQGKLLLPKVESDSLLIYHVHNPSTELMEGSWQLLEPDPSKCPLVKLENIDCILVPGLGFDSMGHRIGYGKGHYDRLIAQFNVLPIRPKTIGLGFKEQLFKGSLPIESHDMPLSEIALF